ncbi:PLP-dependent transferase [Bimuria novae-zelandiae CBS 107.79]|uniref:PLP-dependent transferase n=1 Tax=Bimuria novae-zelandiae CBS 107.79 TaxID=1447943 RepID=A0A6A5VEV8_9PLEO|nr:PLP-dependent transferase [Bimuria novae-zelandiae CBS 107.79]
MDGENATNGTEAPLNRANEVKELLTAIQNLIIPFIKSADEDAATKHTGHGLGVPGGTPRTVLVEHHPPKELEKILNLEVPEKAVGKEGLIKIVESVLKYSVNTWEQGFLDKLYASTNAVGLVSELLLATLNTNAHVYAVSPVLTLIEKHTTKYLANLFGYTSPHAGGITQPGGSASNGSALVIARNTLYPSTKDYGNGDHRFTLFTSAHGHYSLEKAAQMYGLGARAVISVPVDSLGRMIPSELDRLIRESAARGETPFFVNATAGTTVLGSFDPFTAIHEVAKTHGLWLHVDGSWGGSIIFNQRIASSRLEGVHLADSIAVNPHKMLGVPLTCSFLLARDLRQVWKAMTLPAGYLFHTPNADADSDSKEVDTSEIYDLADLTPQCGRRADALKFFLSLSYYGSSHYSSLIAHAYSTADYLLTLLTQHPHFVPVSPTPLPCLQVCFYWARNGVLSEDKEVNGRITEEVAQGLVGRGFMIDYAPGERGRFFRVVVSGGTRRGTVEGLVRGVEEVAGQLGY